MRTFSTVAYLPLALTCALSLACLSASAPDSQTFHAKRVAPLPEPEPAPPVPPPGPSAEEIEMYQAAAVLAQELDITSVPARSGVAGPLDGGAGVLVYVNQQGLATLYAPATWTLLFVKWRPQEGFLSSYGVGPGGSFSLDPSGRATPLAKLPPQVAAWPHAAALVQHLNVQLRALQTQGLAPAYSIAGNLRARIYQDLERILPGLGQEGCSLHDVGTFHIGCW